MAKQFTLGKKERLKSRKSIEQLFSKGKGFIMPPFRVLYLFDTTTAPILQFGVTAGSKRFKKAVDRNRIKRLTREAWRLQKNVLQQALKEQNRQLNIFLVYTGQELPEYKEVYEKMGRIIDKLCSSAIIKK